MSGIGTGYDLSTSTFSPDGRVFQIDYAQKAVDNATTVVGLRCTDGVVLGCEKQVISKMLESGSNRQTFAVDHHAGIATAGLSADGRQAVNRARAEASNYKNFYGDQIPGHLLSDRLASYVHLHGMYWHLRPFGSTCLLATYDQAGPQLYMVETSGTAHRYFGTAAGKGRQSARTAIERLNLKQLTCSQAITEIAKILHAAHDEEKPMEIEMAWVSEASGRKFQLVPQDLVAAADAAAKAALDDSDMEEG